MNAEVPRLGFRVSGLDVSGRTDAEEGVNAEAPRILGSAGCGQHVIRPASATRKGGVSASFYVPK